MRTSRRPPLKVAIIDDHPVVREAILNILSLDPALEIRGAYASSQALIDSLRIEPIDLLVLDFQLETGEIDGISLINRLITEHPELRIIVLSSHERPGNVGMCIRAGAIGFVGKSQESTHLLHAIRMAGAGRIYLAPPMSLDLHTLKHEHPIAKQHFTEQLLLSNYPKLSSREREILLYRLEGLSVGRIALKVGRSCKTVSGQKQAALRKLGIENDFQLFKLQSQLISE